METYEQDYKTTIHVSFSDTEKCREATKGFWCGEHTVQNMVENVCRAFKYEKAYYNKVEDNPLPSNRANKWCKFLEGYGEFVITEDYRGEEDVYRHESEEHRIIEVW